MGVIRMAWRNVWRNRRRTAVTVAAMSLALFVMIQYSGLFEGYITGMERNILDLEMGDLQVFAEGYRNNPSIYTRIQDPEALLDRLDKAGYPASARLLASGLAAAEEASAGVTFRGIDVDRDARVSRIQEHVIRGSWLAPGDPDGVVLGRRLAHTLAVEPGDEIVVLTQGADGSMANEIYKVRGILKNISEAVDRTGVFMTADTYRDLMVLPEGAHQIIVRRPADTELSTAESRVEQITTGLDTNTWRQLIPTLASMLDSTHAAMYTMFLIVYMAVGLVILNAMLMAVFERIREFGVLKALGVGPGEVLGLIIVESMIQTVLALLIGGLFSIPVSWYLSTHGIDLGSLGGLTVSGIAWDPVWRSVINVKTITRPVLILVLVVLVAILYPAIKAALIRPLEAIRHS